MRTAARSVARLTVDETAIMTAGAQSSLFDFVAVLPDRSHWIGSSTTFRCDPVGQIR